MISIATATEEAVELIMTMHVCSESVAFVIKVSALNVNELTFDIEWTGVKILEHPMRRQY
jgi:hypothetical protein